MTEQGLEISETTAQKTYEWIARIAMSRMYSQSLLITWTAVKCKER